MRALAAALLLSTLGCAAQADASNGNAHAAQEAPLKIVFQRSGGFAGFLDRLEISGDRLSLSRRNKVVSQRTLDADEQKTLHALVDAALATPAPGQIGAPGADTFQLTVIIGDAATPQLTGFGHNLFPPGLPPSWDALVHALRALFDQALAASRAAH